MTCPKCGRPRTTTTDTKPIEIDGVIKTWRRRKCPDCKTSFHTVEIMYDVGGKVKWRRSFKDLVIMKG